MDDLRIPLQRPAPAPVVGPTDGAAAVGAESGWGRVIAVSGSRAALAVVLGLLAWSMLPLAVGWTPRAIMSGSMEPRVHVGDVVVGRPVEARSLVPGQVVTVVDPDHPGRTRTHRLLRRDDRGRLVLRGDANPQADSTPVAPSEVLGLGVVRVPYVARPVVWTAERAYLPLGLTVLVLVVLGATAASPLRLPTSSAPPAAMTGPAGPVGPTGPGGPEGDGAPEDDLAPEERDRAHDDQRDDPGEPGDPDEQDDRHGPGARPRAPRPVPGRAPVLPVLPVPAFGPRRRWVALRIVLAGAAAVVLVGASPTHAAYARTTATPSNTWGAAARFTAYRDTVLADAPLLFWRLDSSSGTAAVDSSGSSPGNAGTVSGSFTWGRSGALTASEPVGRALGLTSGQVVQNAASSGLPARFSVEAWFRSTSTTGGLLVGVGDAQASATQDDRVLYLGTDGKVRFGVGASAKAVAVSSAALNDGRWHHVVGVVEAGTGSSSNATVYVDGAAQVATASKVTATVTTGFWRAGSEPLSGWAANPTTPGLVGDLDEVAVYSTPLTATRVKAHYDAGVTP